MKKNMNGARSAGRGPGWVSPQDRINAAIDLATRRARTADQNQTEGRAK